MIDINFDMKLINDELHYIWNDVLYGNGNSKSILHYYNQEYFKY